jgi:hypothetical protein
MVILGVIKLIAKVPNVFVTFRLGSGFNCKTRRAISNSRLIAHDPRLATDTFSWCTVSRF